MTIFKMLQFVILVAMLSAPAGAACFDQNGTEYPRVAVTDAVGTVTLSTASGSVVTLTGLPPNTDVCRNLLFPSAATKCVGNKLHLDAKRDPSFCKGVGKGGTCVHIECDAVASKKGAQKKAAKR